MSFPSSPSNGQQVTVNNITYTYNSTSNAWYRVAGTTNIIVANTATISGNLTANGTTTLSNTSVTGNATVGNLSTSGNLTAAYFLGNGALLTGLSTSSITNGTSNVNIPTANGNVNLTAGGVTSLVVSNTGVFATNLSVTGVFSTGTGTAGSITGANLLSAVYLAGTLTTAAQPNITSLGNLTSITVTGP